MRDKCHFKGRDYVERKDSCTVLTDSHQCFLTNGDRDLKGRDIEGERMMEIEREIEREMDPNA